MIPAHHRLIPLSAAIAEFGLAALFHRDGSFDDMEDTMAHPFGSPHADGPLMALVFDGDTCLDESFDAMAAGAKRRGHMDGTATPLDELLERACTVVVNGNLQAPRIDTRGCQALFVFGSVRCGAFEFCRTQSTETEKSAVRRGGSGMQRKARTAAKAGRLGKARNAAMRPLLPRPAG